MTETRDHGGGIDAAVARWGGTRGDWLDLSTGINPVPYPLPDFAASDWSALPDRRALLDLERAAHAFWGAPDGAGVLAAPGASALIARLPALAPSARVLIVERTYNEHAASFRAAGWNVVHAGAAEAHVVVHPNNPDGALWDGHSPGQASLVVIDESFCDVTPQASLIPRASEPGTVVLKSFGKFWGLAGARLGFAFARPETLARLGEALGPWAVSGPVLRLGRTALEDLAWAERTRTRLAADAVRLDRAMIRAGAEHIGGTDLFRLYEVGGGARWQNRLAAHRILARIFPYATGWLRLGLPGPEADWSRLETALADEE